MKPKIYKIGPTWILWVPGVRVYRFTNWDKAVNFALSEIPSRDRETAATASCA